VHGFGTSVPAKLSFALSKSSKYDMSKFEASKPVNILSFKSVSFCKSNIFKKFYKSLFFNNAKDKYIKTNVQATTIRIVEKPTA